MLKSLFGLDYLGEACEARDPDGHGQEGLPGTPAMRRTACKGGTKRFLCALKGFQVLRNDLKTKSCTSQVSTP